MCIIYIVNVVSSSPGVDSGYHLGLVVYLINLHFVGLLQNIGAYSAYGDRGSDKKHSEILMF